MARMARTARITNNNLRESFDLQAIFVWVLMFAGYGRMPS